MYFLATCDDPSMCLLILKKNVGRILANEDDVVKVLREGNMMKVNVVDMAGMTYGEQLKVNLSYD